MLDFTKMQWQELNGIAQKWLIGRNLKTSEFSDVGCCIRYSYMYHICSSEGGRDYPPFPLPINA